MKTLKLPALELRQGPTRMLITKMRAEDLSTFTQVINFDHEKPMDHPEQGYQRPIETPRIKKFANWLRNESSEGRHVRMPTAILLSARSSDIVLSPDGTITLKSTNRLPLIDGQHRTRGFEHAINQKELDEFRDFEVPVVIMQDIDKIEEMKQFRIVNGEQKSVRTDLVNMILAQLVEKEGEDSIKETEHWKVIASHVVKRLNVDEGGPWFDKIVMPDQRAYSKEEVQADPAKEHLRIARATSFITSLKPIENYLSSVLDGKQTIQSRADELFQAIDGFWSAMRELNPDCFEKSNDYVMQKTPGLFSLHAVCLDVMKKMYKARRSWTKDQFLVMLEPCEALGDSGFWAVGKTDRDRGDAAKYGSMKGFAELADDLKERLENS